MIIKVDHPQDFLVIRSTFELGEYVIVDQSHIEQEKMNLSLYCSKFQWRLPDGSIINKNPGDGFTMEMYNSWISSDEYIGARFFAIEDRAEIHCIKPKSNKIYSRQYFNLPNGSLIEVRKGQYIYCGKGTIELKNSVMTSPTLIFCRTANYTFRVTSPECYFIIFE